MLKTVKLDNQNAPHDGFTMPVESVSNGDQLNFSLVLLHLGRQDS